MMMHSANSTLSTSTNNNNNQLNISQQFPPPDACNNRADWSAQHNNNVGEQNMQEKMSIDHLLQLMSQVGVSIKAGDFSSQLADNIFVLCQQLKTYGQHLEQTNKNDLNRIFISLRQACCRDNGQLAHTQYYLNRPEQSAPPSASGQNVNQQLANSNTLSTQQAPTQLNSGQFNAQSFAPYNTQTLNYCVPPPPPPLSTSQYMFVPTEAPPQPPTTPGYFLIPATNGCWPNPMMPVASPFMPRSPHMQLNELTRGVVPPMVSSEGEWQNRQMAAYLQTASLVSKSQSSTPNSPLMSGIRHLNMAGRVDTSNISTKSNKCQQLREEMTIRNSDSGKIMGVKGRRVALVEELSKTVISFQKVEGKSKNRVLTITGTTQESIQKAKLLIEDTIRRNVSPIRLLTGSDASASEENDAEEEEDDDPGISIETSKDGTLKLCCADPEVLQAAQAALSDYLNRVHRSSRMTAEERDLRKERRKSMPLQSTEKNTINVATPKQDAIHQETRRTFAGSTPNLMAQDKHVEESDPGRQIHPTVDLTPSITPTLVSVYEVQEKSTKFSRSEMLALRENKSEQSAQMEAFAKYVTETMPEIVRNNE